MRKVEQILSGKEKTSCNPTEVLKIVRWMDKIDPSKPFALRAREGGRCDLKIRNLGTGRKKEEVKTLSHKG